MAEPALDQVVLRRLVVQQLLTLESQVGEGGGGGGGGVRVLLRGEHDPEPGAAGAPERWVRLVAVDLRYLPRTRNDHDTVAANVTITINCACATAAADPDDANDPLGDAQRGSDGALPHLLSLIARSLGQATLRDTDTGHQIDLREPATDEDPEPDGPDGARAIATGVVTLTGTAMRTPATPTPDDTADDLVRLP